MHEREQGENKQKRRRRKKKKKKEKRSKGKENQRKTQQQKNKTTTTTHASLTDAVLDPEENLGRGVRMWRIGWWFPPIFHASGPFALTNGENEGSGTNEINFARCFQALFPWRELLWSRWVCLLSFLLAWQSMVVARFCKDRVLASRKIPATLPILTALTVHHTSPFWLSCTWSPAVFMCRCCRGLFIPDERERETERDREREEGVCVLCVCFVFGTFRIQIFNKISVRGRDSELGRPAQL